MGAAQSTDPREPTNAPASQPAAAPRSTIPPPSAVPDSAELNSAGLDAAELKAAGVTLYDPPLPPLREMVEDADGTVRLQFCSEEARLSGLASCRGTVADNCRQGARAACAVNAARSCRLSFLEKLFRLKPEPSWEEQEACELSVMEGCMGEAAVRCAEHADGFCNRAFEDNRVLCKPGEKRPWMTVVDGKVVAEP